MKTHIFCTFYIYIIIRLNMTNIIINKMMHITINEIMNKKHHLSTE